QGKGDAADEPPLTDSPGPFPGGKRPAGGELEQSAGPQTLGLHTVQGRGRFRCMPVEFFQDLAKQQGRRFMLGQPLVQPFKGTYLASDAEEVGSKSCLVPQCA